MVHSPVGAYNVPLISYLYLWTYFQGKGEREVSE